MTRGDIACNTAAAFYIIIDFIGEDSYADDESDKIIRCWSNRVYSNFNAYFRKSLEIR